MSSAAKTLEDAGEAGVEVVARPAARGGRRKLVVLAVPVVLAAIGAGLWFSGILPGLIGMGAQAQHDAEAKSAAPVFVDLPEMIANLNANSRRPSYVKLTARLEVARPEDAERVKAAMPRVVDLFQTYMREMRPEELRGSAGTHRLREELIARAGIAAAPARVKDVLFIELIVQ